MRSNAQFLGLLAVIAHLESLADKASNIRCNPAKAAETGLGVNQMIDHAGHTAIVHMTDQYAAVNAVAIAAAQKQMKEHGSKRLQYGALKRQQAHLLAMTGLVVTDDTPLLDLLCAEVRLRAVVNADKLLEDPTKRELVKDARAALGLPAEGGLTFKQKRDLSYWTRTSVSVPTRIRNVTQQIGASWVLEQQARRPTHTQTQFAMSIMRLSGNKPVKMAVRWKGRRVTLTEKLFIDIVTSFLTTHVAIYSNLSGGSPGPGDVASRAMVDGLCAMADRPRYGAGHLCCSF